MNDAPADSLRDEGGVCGGVIEWVGECPGLADPRSRSAFLADGIAMGLLLLGGVPEWEWSID